MTPDPRAYISAGWRASAITLYVLQERGYWPSSLVSLQMDFLAQYLVDRVGTVDADIDNQFIQWVEKRMPNPVCICLLDEWLPSRQLRYNLSTLGQKRLETMLTLYKASCQGRGEGAEHMDHDLGFLGFVQRWN